MRAISVVGRVSVADGDVVAKRIARGTLNGQVVGWNLSAASWLTM